MTRLLREQVVTAREASSEELSGLLDPGAPLHHGNDEVGRALVSDHLRTRPFGGVAALR
jgi:hypothetical protein